MLAMLEWWKNDCWTMGVRGDLVEWVQIIQSVRMVVDVFLLVT